MDNSSTGPSKSHVTLPETHDAFAERTIFVQRGSHARNPSQKFPRISKPVELLRPSYDVVVIGSGYGGGVAASRMARGEMSVCVLERGKERWPGEYPNSLLEVAPQWYIHGKLFPGPEDKYIETGDPTGLYRLNLGEGQTVFTGCGLGGTSLLNANIFLQADKKTLELGEWPTDIREHPEILDPYYKRAESMLQPESYPTWYPELAKLSVLEKQAESLGLKKNFYRPPQTTRFEDGPNSTGVMMHASTGSGSDSSGVNDGSKTTTLVTYLSDAWNWGAEIFCECEVKYIRKAPEAEGYIVYFAWHGSERGKFSDIFANDLMWVHAKKFVFLGAGTLGTTEILLRSKQLGLQMSDAVGTRMSGNGDIFAFGYNTDFEVNALQKEHPDPAHPVGPTITGIIDCRDQKNPLDGFVLEEGAVARSLILPLQLILETAPGAIHSRSKRRSWFEQYVSRSTSKIFGPYYPGGSLQRTQVYLIMSHDSNQANMVLDGKGRPLVKWLGVGRSQHVKTLDSFMARATEVIGGTFVNNPFFTVLDKQEASVHPVGGAALSSDGTAEEGVTTSYGELLTGIGTGEIHDGIVCVDGSVIPSALGVNPFATITALAERSVEHVAAKRGIKIDYETNNGLLDLFGPPNRSLALTPGLQQATEIIEESKRSDALGGSSISEVMEGYIYAGGDIEDFKIAAEVGRGVSSSARFFLSVHGWNTTQHHAGMLTGTFSCGALSRDPFLVLRGKFQLFKDDPVAPDAQSLSYDFVMINTGGEVYRFEGRKVVGPSIAFSPGRIWQAESTLYVSIYRAEGNVLVGRGILHIRSAELMKELENFQFDSSNLFSKAKTQFLRLFFAVSALHDKPLPAENVTVTADDGVQSNLLMWTPPATETSDPFLDPNIPVLFIPGASVDHRMFAMPTLRVNAIEYFTGHGATCFCVTHRVGRTEVAKEGWSTYDARLDIAAALAYILKRYPNGTKAYIVAHGVGSIALSIGLLDGTIPPSHILGMTCSQVFMNPRFTKGSIPKLLIDTYKRLAGQWYSYISDKHDVFVQQILNQLLRLYPVGSRTEICHSVVCQRAKLVFGELWVHGNLDAQTHNHLEEFLGGISMHNLNHLILNATRGYVTTWPSPLVDGGDVSATNLVTLVNLEHLRNLPIYLFSGSDNGVFSPDSTNISYTVLRDAWGEGQYEREVFDGFGHLDCWMGEKAASVIWPRVKEHMKKTIRTWDISTGKDMKFLGAITDIVTSIFSGFDYRKMRIWDATVENDSRSLEWHAGCVTCLCFSPDDTRIVSGSDDKTIRVWNTRTGMRELSWQGHTKGITSVGVSPDGMRIISGSQDRTIRIWDSRTGEEVMKPLEGHTDGVTSVAFITDVAHIISGSRDKTIRIWDLSTGGQVDILLGHNDGVTSVGFSLNGRFIVSGSRDNTVRIWDAKTGEIMKLLEGHTKSITSVGFSLDGARIVSGSQDTTIRIWDSRTGEHLITLEGHTDGVTSVTLSTDGTRIASGSHDKTIRVWSARTGEQIVKPLKGHKNVVTSVVFSPHENFMVSGSSDMTIRLWDVNTTHPLYAIRSNPSDYVPFVDPTKLTMKIPLTETPSPNVVLQSDYVPFIDHSKLTMTIPLSESPSISMLHEPSEDKDDED